MDTYIYDDSHGFKIRFATAADVPLIHQLIQELAVYEKLLHEVVADEAVLMDSLFVKQQAEVLIAEYQGKPIGYALFCQNFSTFLGKANIYLEDLYVQPEMRNHGFGKRLLAMVAKLAVERGCQRVDWACLNWNTPSLAFYHSIGAQSLQEWTTLRLEKEALTHFSMQLE